MFDPCKDECRVAGIAVPNGFYNDIVVPCDSEEGCIGETVEMVSQQSQFATPVVHNPFQEPSEEELVGYPVHVP